MRGTLAHTKRRVLTARPGTSPAAQLLCPRVAKQLHPSFFQNILIFLPPSHSFWRANWGAALPAMLLGAAGRATQLPPPGLAISRPGGRCAPRLVPRGFGMVAAFWVFVGQWEFE